MKRKHGRAAAARACATNGRATACRTAAVLAQPTLCASKLLSISPHIRTHGTDSGLTHIALCAFCPRSHLLPAPQRDRQGCVRRLPHRHRSGTGQGLVVVRFSGSPARLLLMGRCWGAGVSPTMTGHKWAMHAPTAVVAPLPKDRRHARILLCGDLPTHPRPLARRLA